MPRQPKGVKGWKAKAWRLFSEFIRRRDSDDNGYCRCVTCGGSYHWTEMQAGHAIGGRKNAVLLDERIVHAQCYGCNGPKDGMYEVYVPKMIDLHGREVWDEIAANARKPYPMKVCDWKDKCEEYSEKLKEMEK